MAEKILNTRIQLKYDSYANWTKLDVEGKYGNLVLKKGEIGICEIPSGNANATTAPTVLFKVGDGTLPFHHEDPTKCLKWASALAADVHTWAKAATKPEYQASEIKGLDEYIAGEIQDTNTDTQYSFEIVDGKLEVKKTLYTLGVAGTPETVGTYDFVTPEELTNILADYYTKTEVDNLIQGVNDKIDGLDESITTVAKGTGISVEDTGTGNDHAYTVALDVNGAKTALGLDAEGIAAYVTVESLNATAKGYADGKDGAIQAAHQAGTDAANALDAYKTEMTNDILPGKADKSVVDAMYTNEQIDALLAEKQNNIPANTYDAYGAAAAVLGESTDGAAANTVYGAKAAAAAAQADATIAKTKIETFLGTVTPDGSDAIIDTLTEINNYVGEHGEEFAALSGRVTKIEDGTTVVPKAADADTLDGHNSDYFATAADYLTLVAAAEIYATKSDAAYTAGDNIDITKNKISVNGDLTGISSLKINQDAGFTLSEDGRIDVDGHAFEIRTDSVTVNGTPLNQLIAQTKVNEAFIADKATQDANGKVIADTYATKTEATYTAGNNIDVTNRVVSLNSELNGITGIYNEGAQLSVKVGDSKNVGFELHQDGVVAFSGRTLNISMADGVSIANNLYVGEDLSVTGDVTIGGKTLAAVITSTKVNNAGHADTASSAAHATEADAATNDQFGHNIAETYATKEEAANQAVTALAEAQKYADELAVNYATAAQGAKADSAIQSVTTAADCGIKATTANNVVTLDWDTDVVFVFNCGDSTN